MCTFAHRAGSSVRPALWGALCTAHGPQGSTAMSALAVGPTALHRRGEGEGVGGPIRHLCLDTERGLPARTRLRPVGATRRAMFPAHIKRRHLGEQTRHDKPAVAERHQLKRCPDISPCADVHRESAALPLDPTSHPLQCSQHAGDDSRTLSLFVPVMSPLKEKSPSTTLLHASA